MGEYQKEGWFSGSCVAARDGSLKGEAIVEKARQVYKSHFGKFFEPPTDWLNDFVNRGYPNAQRCFSQTPGWYDQDGKHRWKGDNGERRWDGDETSS